MNCARALVALLTFTASLAVKADEPSSTVPPPPLVGTEASTGPVSCVVDGTFYDDCCDSGQCGTGGVGGGGGGGAVPGPMLPDFFAVGGSFAFSPKPIQPGDAYSGSVILQKAGGAVLDNGTMFVNFYLAPPPQDPFNPELRYHLGQRIMTHWPSFNSTVLIPFKSSDESFSTLSSTVADGDYRLAVSIDPGTIAESTTLNNTLAAGPTVTVRRLRPDLRPVPPPAGVQFPGKVKHGAFFTIKAKVRNDGLAPLMSPANFPVRFRAVRQDVIDNGGGKVIASVNAAMTSPLDAHTERDIPPATTNVVLEPGKYQLRVEVDAHDNPGFGAVQEANEGNNNLSAGTFEVTVSDLEPMTLSFQDEVPFGQFFPITAGVLNSGPGDLLGPASYKLDFRAIPCTVVSTGECAVGDNIDGALIASVNETVTANSPFMAGELRSVSATTTAALSVGTYRIQLDVDDPAGTGTSFGQVREDDEFNNSLLSPGFFVVQPAPPPPLPPPPFLPDLIVRDLVVQQDRVPMAAGHGLTVKYTIENIGTARLPAGAIVKTAVQLSQPGSGFNQSGDFLGHGYNDVLKIELSPGASDRMEHEEFLDDIRAGSYQVVAKVDPFDSYQEVDNDNNVTLGPTIQVEQVCAQVPTSEHAKATFEELLMLSQYPDGTSGPGITLCTSPSGGNGGGEVLLADFVFFGNAALTPGHGHFCNHNFTDFHIKAISLYVFPTLLPAMRRFCAHDPAELHRFALTEVWEQAKSQAALFVQRRNAAKTACDDAANAIPSTIPVDSRRYCQCTNTSYFDGQLPPHPGDIVNCPIPVSAP
jgi:CARDB